MARSPDVTVRIDSSRLRANAIEIRRETGVAVLAVVKADAYGLGAAQVAAAVTDLVDGFCVFRLEEGAALGAVARGKTVLVLGPPVHDAGEYRRLHLRPAVSSVEQARGMRHARPVLCVDTGMQRFACPPEQAAEALREGACEEAFTHATRLEQAGLFWEWMGGRGLRLHAAGSSLLHEPSARFDAVRPGLALCRGAMRVSARLADVRASKGPAGYSGFQTPHHGVILAGYSNGVRPGPCLVNGRRSRLIEVGMQSSFVETSAADRAGDEVVLLGDGLLETDISAAWATSPQEVLMRLGGAGERSYKKSAE